MKRGKPLERRKPLARGDSQLGRSELKRKGSGLKALRPDKRSKEEVALRKRWEVAAGRYDGHHALRRSVIERLAADAGLPVIETAWDLAWMIHLTRDAHERHTNRSRRLPFSVVPERAREAANALDDALEAAGRPRTAMLQLRREYS